jgi:hypothetical protein
MTQEHPITPPSEGLVLQWSDEWYKAKVKHMNREQHLCMQAAHWGADQELEACCEWLNCELGTGWGHGTKLRAARRPKPPSLKELNLKHLEVMERDGHYLPEIIADLRRAIESLPS